MLNVITHSFCAGRAEKMVTANRRNKQTDKERERERERVIEKSHLSEAVAATKKWMAAAVRTAISTATNALATDVGVCLYNRPMLLLERKKK